MKKRFISFFIAMFIVLSLLPMPVEAAKPLLYKVTNAGNLNEQPFRIKAGGDIIGSIPSNTIIEVASVDGDWAKIKYKGNQYFMWADKLKKVDAPAIVCSPWAKEWLSAQDGSYYGISGEWSGSKEDWTKPITREDMAILLVEDVMISIYGDWAVQFSLKGAFKGADELRFEDISQETGSYEYLFQASRLLYWGIIPPGKFNPKTEVTYGEFTDALIKLMAYDKKIVREGGGADFTKATIDKFAIGGNTNPNSKITKEQAKILSQKTFCWWQEMQNSVGSKHERANKTTRGSSYLDTGVYTMRTLIGTKSKQPHLVINTDGKGELSNSKSQKFKLTYKKCVLGASNTYMMLYTIQTLDGKYLALSGTPVNGSRLVAQDKEYLWCIDSGNSKDSQFASVLYSTSNGRQLLNASAWKTTDGTHVISWYWDASKGEVPDNCFFIFDYEG